jgi:prevent-host-death family protein
LHGFDISAAIERERLPRKSGSWLIDHVLYDHLVGQEPVMDGVNIAEFKARVSELVERAAAGETVEITRRGKPMAKLVPHEPKKKRFDAAALKAFTDALPMQTQSAVELIREMRDSGY